MFARALQEVFKNPRYVILSGAVSLIAFSLTVWIPNAQLIFRVATSENASLFDTLTFSFRLFASITTNFTVLSATYTLAIAILLGINVALILYVIKRQKDAVSKSGTTSGILGIASGIIGIGCSACGSVILVSVLAALGGVGTLAFLPLNGGEFGILGTLLLLVSSFFLARQITLPVICYPKN